jgi:hypothetical protein
MSKWRVVKWDKAGQMQLVASAPIAAGEEILREKPLVTVANDDDEPGSQAWALSDRLLADASLRNTYYSWTLRSEDIFPTKRKDSEIERLLAKGHGVPRPMVRKLYVGVRSNHIGYGLDDDAEPRGYGLYQALSRVNHSCEPCAALSGADAMTGEQSLVAIRDIQPGQEITRKYAGQASNFLERNFLVRNVFLVDRMGFVCLCSRCRRERPEDLKDVNLLHFFRDFLKVQAEKKSRQASSQGHE